MKILTWQEAQAASDINMNVDDWMQDDIDTLREALCKAPAWHDKPTCAGIWICNETRSTPYSWSLHRVAWPLHPDFSGASGERFYGPLPECAP